MDFYFKTYTQSSEYLDKDRIENNKPVAGKLTKVIYFLFYNSRLAIIRFFIWIFVSMLIAFILACKNDRSNSRKYPSGKYKRVVKEGFFWDSTEYHER